MNVAALTLSTWLALVCTAEPGAPIVAPKLQRIDFAADHPETWPRTNPPLEAIPRDEFERLWSSLQPQRELRPRVVLERAVYQASLVQDRLQGGTFTADIHRTEPPSAWLRWSPFNLALSELRWQDGPATFGADASGQHWLLADRERRTLTGAWTLLGRRIGRQTEFRLEVPEAVSSTVVLRIPRGLQLACSEKTIPLEAGTPEGPWVTWRVDLGSHRSATLIVRATDDETARPPVVLYRKQLSAELGEDQLRFQVNFTTEVLNVPVQELEFTLPKPVDLYSITYGIDTPLRWTRVADDGNRVRVRVTLPDAVQGELRPLRMEGLMSRRPNTTVVIPQVECTDAVFLGGRHTITLLRPLQLTSTRLTGCRESAAVTPTNEGDSYQFQQFLPNALLMLDVRRPTPQLLAQTLSAVTFRAEEWQQRTEILWSTLNGSAFQVTIQVPRDWEVTDVDALTSSGNADPINWDLDDDAEGRQLLHAEFLEAVTPTSPRVVRLLTRQRRTAETRMVPLPTPRPLDVSTSESVLALQGEGAYRIGLPAGPQVSAVTPSALPDSWRAFPLWSTLLREEDRHSAVWCRVDAADASIPFVLEREPPPAEIAARVHAKLTSEAIEETYELSVRPEQGRSCDRVLAYINEMGGECTWSVISPVGNNLVASRVPIEQHALWNLPVTGELWEIRLPESATAEWKLQGVRKREKTVPLRIGLIATPQSTHSSAIVTAEEAISVPLLEWNARGLRELDTKIEDGARVRRWEYSRLSVDLIGNTASATQSALRTLVDAQLRSTLSPVESAEEIHELRLNLRGSSPPFTLSLPEGTSWVTAKINGEVVPVDAGRQLRIAVLAPDEPVAVEWVYRSLPSRSSWNDRRRIPWPSGFPEAVWTRFEWILQAPPNTYLDASASGLRAAEPLPAVSWRRRFFGPLAREDHANLFMPWRRDGWNQIWPTTAGSSATSANGADSLQPIESVTRHFYGPQPPESLLVEVVDLGHTHLLAWVLLLVSAIVVMILRVSCWSQRDRVAVIMLTVGAALTCYSAGPWTEVFGGWIAGIMIGGLLPRRWWQPVEAVQPQTGHVPGGSTQSFVFPQPVSVLLLCAWAASSAFAAENAVPPRIDVTVYVPVDDDGQPSRRLPFVYLAPDQLKQLRSQERQRTGEAPNMLVERADYRVTIGSEPRASFSVTYRILTPANETTACDLVLPSVTLSGTQSCLLDGQPAAVAALVGKRGLRITIPAATSAVSAIHAVQFASHEVTLDFDHPWRRSPVGGMCELLLPKTAWTRAEINGLSPTSDVQFENVLGGWERSLDSRQATVALGAADRLSWMWQERSAAESRPVQALRATTVERLDVSAAAIEARCRSTIIPQNGGVTHLAWDFPADTVFRNLQTRPAGRAEIKTLPKKVVRVEVDFYEPVHDAAVLESQFLIRHAPLQGEFTWRGVIPAETPGTQFERTQRLWAVSSVPEIRVQPQSVENSGLVPVAAESVKDLFTGLTTDQLPPALFQVATDSPVAFRWTTITPLRRLLVWQQRGEIVGTRLNWTVEADLECSTQPPVYSHSFLVDRRLQIDQISVRERGAERRLRWTESRSSGSPQSRVTIWLTDPCLETQRITLTAHMPLSTTGPLTLPNVRCEDAELVGGRWELQSSREMRGSWQTLRGLKSLSSTDDRLDVSQHWIFEQTDLEPRAVIRLQTRRLHGVGHALYMLAPSDAGQLRLRARWEMPSSEMLAGLQFMVPKPWKLVQSPTIQGAKLAALQESDHGAIVTLGTLSRAGMVVVEMLTQAPRTEFSQRHIVMPQLSHDPGMVSWIAETVSTNATGVLDGLANSTAADWPEWVSAELNRGVDGAVGPWRTAASNELPQEWPRTQKMAAPQEARFDWLEHRAWFENDHAISGASRAWLEVPSSSLTWTISPEIELQGAEVDGKVALMTSVQPGVWEISAERGSTFRTMVVYWRSKDMDVVSWYTPFSVAVPVVSGRTKFAPTLTVFPPPGREFLSNYRWSGNGWPDRGLQRIEALGDHLAFRRDDEDATPIAIHMQRLYESTAEKFGRHVTDVAHPGSARAERWAASVTRMNQAAPLLKNQGPPRPSSELDDLLLDHPDACYRLNVADGRADSAWFLPDATRSTLYALAIILFGYPLLRRGIRCEWSPWLSAHSHLTLGLLGLVWWLCLSPSIAGFALAVATLISWLMSRRHGEAAAAA